MSRLAPDRRQARWWPVALSTLSWRSLKRHPSGTNVHCDKGHIVVTRATATGAEDMAISLDPPGQGRHQRSRWSRPGSCRTRGAPVIPRSTRRTPVEIAHPQGKRCNRRSSLKKETRWGSLTPAGRDTCRSTDAPENLRRKGFHSTPAISATAETLKKSLLAGVGCDQRYRRNNLLRLDVVDFNVFPALQARKVDLVVKVFEVSNERNVLQLLVT